MLERMPERMKGATRLLIWTAVALMLVLEWPTPKVSNSLSRRCGKGAKPCSLRMVLS